MLIIFMSTSSLVGMCDSMKGELGGLVAVVDSWLGGYGGYSHTPWVRVPQLPVFLFSPFSPSGLGSNETSIIIHVLCTAKGNAINIRNMQTLIK